MQDKPELWHLVVFILVELLYIEFPSLNFHLQNPQLRLYFHIQLRKILGQNTQSTYMLANNPLIVREISVRVLIYSLWKIQLFQTEPIFLYKLSEKMSSYL